MKVLLDIKDNKADFVMELLKNLSFVKVEPISTAKTGKVKLKATDPQPVTYNNEITSFFEKQINACFRDCPFKVQKK